MCCSRAAEPEESEAILETEQRLEKIRQSLQQKESQELEQLRQRQVEAEQELEELKRRREERRRLRQDQEQRREEEEQQRLAKEEVRAHDDHCYCKGVQKVQGSRLFYFVFCHSVCPKQGIH